MRPALLLPLLVLALVGAACESGSSSSAGDGAKSPPPASLTSRLGTACTRKLHALELRYQRANTTLVAARDRIDTTRRAVRRERAVVARERTSLGHLNRTLAQRRRAVQSYLATHGTSLPPAEYDRYQALRGAYNELVQRYNAAVRRFNAQVQRTNRDVGTYNAAVGRAHTAAEQAGEVDASYRGDLDGCLGGVQDWNGAVDSLEHELADAASVVAKTDPTVDCSSPKDWDDGPGGRSTGPFEEQGYVQRGSKTIHLAPHVCASLDQVVRHDAHRVGLACAVRELRDPVRACPPALADVALALVTLAHEAEHVSGVTNEAETECDARQNVRQLAVRLGVRSGQAAILGRYAGRRAADARRVPVVGVPRRRPLRPASVEPRVPLKKWLGFRAMNVAQAVARALYQGGVRTSFGVLGSGNFLLANALREAGIDVHTARHENNAMSMADGYGRASGRVAVCTTHQGPGFTNSLTGLVEAAKARTPAILLTADTPAGTLWSNFQVDQTGIALGCGALVDRVRSPATAAEDAARALRRSLVERLPVVLNVPVDLPGCGGSGGPHRGAARPDARAAGARSRQRRGRRRAGRRRRAGADPGRPRRRRVARRAGGARGARRARRRAPGHERDGPRPVQRPAVRARDRRRLRLPDLPGAGRRGRPRAGLRRGPEPLDDAPRRAPRATTPGSCTSTSTRSCPAG